MKQKIIIMGAGGNALDVHDIVSKEYNVLGFLDDNLDKQHFSYRGTKVLGPLNKHEDYSDAKLVFCIGSYKNHTKRQEIIKDLGLEKDSERFPIVAHDNVVISPSAQLSHGVILLSGCSIGANVRIDPFVLCLQNTVISHDSLIGQGSLCACNVTLSGNIKIGSGCYLGAGCVVRDNLTVADNTLIGMGAVVTSSITQEGVYIGVPAQRRQG